MFDSWLGLSYLLLYPHILYPINNLYHRERVSIMTLWEERALVFACCLIKYLKWMIVILTLSSMSSRMALFSYACERTRFRCSNKKFDAWSLEPMLPRSRLTLVIASCILNWSPTISFLRNDVLPPAVSPVTLAAASLRLDAMRNACVSSMVGGRSCF